MSAPRLPSSIVVLERGWLSANNIVGIDGDTATLIDSGYVGHAEQTLALVDHAMGSRQLTWLVNTHCHSDHMGGNHALQTHHGCRTSLPVGEAAVIDRWDDKELILGYADQRADRFRYDDTFADGDVLRMGAIDWQVIGAPGHDDHAVMFFAPDERVLIAGDALWQTGFGVVFGALLGDTGALTRARETLERIARLEVRVVIPGHGAVFDDVEGALQRAFTRLAAYGDLEKLARHCVKALFTYAILDKRTMPLEQLERYLQRVPVMIDLNRDFIRQPWDAFARWLLADLQRAGALALVDGNIVPRIKA